MSRDPPTVVVYGGHHLYALSILAELAGDLDAHIVAVGSAETSAVVRSRYADETRVCSSTDTDSRLLAIVEEFDADLLLPVGYRETVAADAIRDEVPATTTLPIAPPEALSTALDKYQTMALAEELDIDVPGTLARIPATALSDPDVDPEAFDYPVFLKAQREAGTNILARVEDPSDFESELAALASPETGAVLVQEYVAGDGATYGCGVVYADGELQQSVTHREIRSIPREGGTGTRVQLIDCDRLRKQSIALLEALDWDGPALVEYRKRADGTYTLMEINPKFWSSYALASENGHRFASTIADRATTATARDHGPPALSGEMVFPIRELYHALDSDESILGALRNSVWPPAPVDVDVTDLPAWLLPAGPLTTVRWAVQLYRGTGDPVEELRA